ncbi:hypothetical protein KGY58_04610 [Candidatus Bipolaricaulota bacterium]|nr:hypothetical protein [Candidatus Bipolaricaulota bacterium]
MSEKKRQYGSLITISLLTVLLVITLGLTVQGEDQEANQETRESISILIIDQTGSFATSMQTELLARNLTDQLDADIQARTDIPGKVNEGGSYGLIFVIPERLPQVWTLTGLVPYKVPEEKREALEGIQKIAKKIYSQEDFPKRKVVGIIDDLAPAACASYLVRYGWLEGPGNLN